MGNKITSNETISIDIKDIESSPIDDRGESEAAFTYQRENGTIERAMSAEDAVARCPALGKLAIEAPEQLDILLELAEMGNKKMKAEKKKSTNKNIDDSPENVIQITRKKQNVIEPEENKLHFKSNDKEILNLDNFEPIDRRIIISSTTDSSRIDEIYHHLENDIELAVPSNKNEVVISVDAVKPIKKSEYSVDIDSTSKKELFYSPTIKEIEPIYLNPNESIQILNEDILVDEHEPSIGSLETVYENYVLEAHEIISDLVNDDESLNLFNLELQTEEIQNLIEFYSSIMTITYENDGELALESIIYEANEQPLDQTLSNLIHIFSKDSYDTQGKNDSIYIDSFDQEELSTELKIKLMNIYSKIPYCFIEDGKQTNKFQISIEMTKELVSLLEFLGYENPDAVLIDFINQYGLNFLLKSLIHIYKLQDNEYRLEHVISQTITTNSDDHQSKLLNLSRIISGMAIKHLSLVNA